MDNYNSSGKNPGNKKSRKTRQILVSYITTVLLSFVLIVVVVLYFFISMAMRTVRAYQINHLDSELEHTTYMVDYLIETYVCSPFTQLQHQNSIQIISFTTPNYSINPNAVQRVKVDLNTFVSNSELIKSAVLYVYSPQLVITSEYSDGQYPEAPYSFIISDFDREDADSFVGGDGNTVYCYKCESEYIFAKDIFTYGDSVYSTLFFVLNTDELGRLLGQETDSAGNIHLLDWNSDDICSNASINQDLELDIDAAYSALNKDCIEKDGMVYFTQSSSILGWVVSKAMQSDSVFPTTGLIITQNAPAFIIIILIILILMATIIVRLYRPISVLLSSLRSQGIISSPDSVDFSAITKEIDRLLAHQSNLNRLLDSVSSDAIKKLFRSLFSDEQPSYEDIRSALDIIPTEFTFDGVYASCAIRLLSYDDSNADRNLKFRTTVEAALSLFAQKYGISQCTIDMSNTLCAGVLMFSINSTIPDNKLLLSKLSETVIQSCRMNGLQVEFSSGPIYHSILDVNYSYIEAKKKFTGTDQSAIYRTACNDASANPQPVNHEYQETDREIIVRRAKAIIQHVLNTSGEFEESLINHIIDDVETSFTMDVESVYKHLLYEIINQIAAIELIPYTPPIDILSNIDSAFASLDSPSAIKEYTHRTLMSLVTDLSSAVKRKNNPYILKALAYIHENYNDYSLSLESIAAYLSVSPSYLSKLFSSNTNTHLFEYICHYRVRASVRDLLDTELNVSEIAEKNGFSSARTYTRAFVKYYETTPNKYRQSHLE